MKINYILALVFIAFVSFVVIANINDPELIGCTELNGSGCVCHALDRDFNVTVWVEGPDTLEVGETGHYKMLMAGGPAEGGGYNVAGRFGEMILVDTFSFQHPLTLNELTQAFTLPFPTTQDTIYWDFAYTVSDSTIEWDTIYSCGISLVWDSIPDPLDRWNFGTKFPVRIVDNVTSVNNISNFADDYLLHQNYPNPFNPSTTIEFYLPENSNVRINIYNLNGELISSLFSSYLNAGNHSINFNAENLSSGVYYYSMNTDEKTIVKKMLLLK
jgi:hypothetical protein